MSGMNLQDRIHIARRALGRSVIEINPDAEREALDKDPDFITFGVKDSSDIPAELVRRLRESRRCLMLTVDRMSDLGRSIDVELVNPLTYRPMTGSTSGGAINVLKGINDFCIGTDGGGSVLAPALATNLYSLMCKGLSLTAGEGRSTDGMPFATGIGFIGRSPRMVIEAGKLAGGFDLSEPVSRAVEIIAPEHGTAALPGGGDMRTALQPYLGMLSGLSRVTDHAFSDVYDRQSTVTDLRDIWAIHPRACIITIEGPIDVYSADETIPRSFTGSAPALVAGCRSKAVCKAVNIAGGSAMTVPTENLATGILVSCGPGLEVARGMCAIVRELSKRIELPEMFRRYFLERSKAPHPFNVWHG